MRRVGPLLALLAGALAMSGCTLVPTSNKLVIISDGNVHLGLLNKTIPGTNGAQVRFVVQPVYIVDASNHLAPSSRIVPSPASLDSVLGQLILGPTAIERSAGYSSALPAGLIVLQATVKNDIGYIDLSKALTTLTRQRQILAIGQLMLTVHGVDSTNRIVISVSGVTQKSLLPDGKRAEIVTAADCQSLLNP
ncbi:MAG TPA: GerMN domain-containing protein [Acidimicrobiales bacterium]